MNQLKLVLAERMLRVYTGVGHNCKIMPYTTHKPKKLNRIATYLGIIFGENMSVDYFMWQTL